jgi:phosphoribosyl 1,2-cyclic phosphate phosphodiesterase
MRSSVWIREGDISIVVDTGPEFRIQAIRAHIMRLDAVFFTHNHADHLNGIDDLRVFTEHGALPVYGPKQVLFDISQRFPYAVGTNCWQGGLPQLILNEVPHTGVRLGNLEFIPIPLIHGCREVYGYRIGSFAYLTDCKEIPEESYKQLEGVRTLVIDALRQSPHPTHMCIDEAIVAAQRIGSTSTFFTHMTHRVEHGTLDRSLPAGIHPAYDGLTLQVQILSGETPNG